MRSYSKDEFLRITPASFLAEGWRERDGAVRSGLLSVYATAVANQLLAGELPPQELAFTIEAIRLHLPLHPGEPAERFAGALDESLQTVARMIRQPNNEGLVQWLQECARHVRSGQDLAALDAHMVAVLRQYGVVASFSEEASSSSPPLQ